ncbi:MAG: hypothetical protein ABI833_05665 [Acidobacteriota bacterium]
MEVYKSETREVLDRFLSRRISFPSCIAALDAALAGLLPRMHADELPALRELMMANNEVVMKELERRGQRKKAKTTASDAPPQEVAVPKPVLSAEKVRTQLQQELKHAAERATTASAAFLEVTNQVPSGLPHPDGTQRIRNISHELAFARSALMRAHSRLDTFLVSGIAPEDFVIGGE